MILRFFKKRSEPSKSPSKRSESAIGQDVNDDAKHFAEVKKSTASKAKKTDAEVKTENKKKIKKLRNDPTIDGQLRLAMLLQKDGSKEEGFGILSGLMAKGAPDSNWPDFLYSDHCRIHDKMRLFLQREGNDNEAICHHVLSLLCDLTHQTKRNQIDRAYFEENDKRFAEYIEEDDGPSINEVPDEKDNLIESRKSPENLRKYLTPVMKKAGKLDLLEDLEALVSREVANLDEFPKRRGQIFTEIEKLIAGESCS